MQVKWNMIDDVIGIMHLSDVHYGNPRVDPYSITEGLRHTLPLTHNPWPNLKLFLVHGDYFDSDFRLAHDAAGPAQAGMVHILQFCKAHNLILRILEGTPKHDRKQSKHFFELNASVGYDVDVRHVCDLEIEHITALGIDILYVPDERNLCALDTLEEAQQLIRSRGLERVHLSSFHGAWLYQMPIVHKSYHDSAAWANLVEWYIFSGHIHTHSRYLKNVSVGSWGRNFHGEEEDKGMLYSEHRIGVDGGDINFIRNPCTRTFKTFEVFDMEYPAIIEMIEAAALPDRSAVRLRHDGSTAIKTTLELLAERYPQYTWTEVSKKEKKDEHEPGALDDAEMDEEVEFISMTPENTGSMLERELRSGNVDLRGQSPDELMALFKEVADE